MSLPRGLTLFLLTALSLIAFAANSVLARLALVDGELGPWSYVLIRFVSGALMLALLIGPAKSLKEGSWRGAGALLLYGVFFSFAYLMLTTGTGALILFAAVQLTMLGWGYFKGERLSPLQWLGFGFAVSGLIYLLSPGLEAPSLLGSVLMILAGLGWGFYSIIGKGAGNPTAQTAGNFIRAAFILLLAAIPVFWVRPEAAPTAQGWGLALTSGIVTSALGYALWYRVLKDLPVTTAGLSQLSVPALAAIGGVLFVSEPLTLRFVLASAIILTGVGLATLRKGSKT